jgi:hypothetical protein
MRYIPKSRHKAIENAGADRLLKPNRAKYRAEERRGVEKVLWKASRICDPALLRLAGLPSYVHLSTGLSSHG